MSLSYAFITSGGCGSFETRSVRQLLTSLVLIRIDYCNIVLAGLPPSTISPLTAEPPFTVKTIDCVHLTGPRKGA